MTDRTGQTAIQALSVGGNRQTSPGAVAGIAKKFNPGWGVFSTTGYTSLHTGISTQDVNIINEIATMPNVKHFQAWFYWGGIETSQGVYNFTIIDQLLALCQQKGIRLSIMVQWSAISAGSVAFQLSQGRFPAYLNEFPPLGGYTGLVASATNTSIAPRVDPQLHRPEIMDRWIALHQALANRYDTHPWFEATDTYDSTPSTLVTLPDPSFTQTAWQTQFKRMMVAMGAMWPRTNVMISMDWGFTQNVSQTQSIVQTAADNHCVFSCIDIQCSRWLPGGSEGTWMQQIFLGVQGTKDFRNEMAFGGRSAGGNFGGKGTATAAQYPPADFLDVLLIGILNNNLEARWMFMPYKTAGHTDGGTDNDQFWNTNASGYTLYHPTIKEFLNATTLTHTEKPANYGDVITGGT